MKTLYIECNMGAAGDMLTAALLEAAYPRSNDDGELSSGAEAFAERFNSLGIPGVEMHIHKDEKQGVRGTRVHISVNGEEEHEPDHDHDHNSHHHRTMKDIEEIIASLELDGSIKEDILSVYRMIAEAEGSVHGMPAGEVHFHEVGAMDAVADVAAVCMLMHEIAADEVVASPVATGFGSVRCAHGVLPVPAPATALILKGMPAYAGDIKGELCTPTGAALIKHFADRYSQMPLMSTETIGYGLGTKDFEKANILRVFIGETD